jgi:hypothetical protein
MKLSISNRKALWLGWYAALCGLGLLFIWIELYVFVHHMFILAGPRIAIWTLLAVWPLLLGFAIAKLFKHAQRGLR